MYIIIIIVLLTVLGQLLPDVPCCRS